METSLKVIDNAKGSCTTSNSAGCEPSKPVPSIRERAALLNRRELGLTILGASAAALLAGCSQPAPTGQASPPATAAPAAPALSPDLAVVQQSKGPVTIGTSRE
jgi:hypothetical protein